MTHETPQSLLSLPSSLSSPDAYRVLGLSALEADRAKIEIAANATIAKLKALKAETQPAAWATAVQWVQTAFTILNDPSKKAAYDRKLAAEIAKQQAGDPLAGFLPTGPVQTSAAAVVPVVPVLPPALPPSRQPSMTDASSEWAANLAATPVASTQQTPREPAIPVLRNMRARRRRILWTSIVLSLFCLVAIGGLVGAVYWLQNNSNQIVVNFNPGATLGPGGVVVAPPMPNAPKYPVDRDSVMGQFAGDVAPPSRADPEAGMTPPEQDERLARRLEKQRQRDAEAAMQASLAPQTESPLPNILGPNANVPETEMPEMPETPGSTDPMLNSPAATATQIAAADSALTELVAIIQRREWNAMQPKAKSILALPMDDAQKDRAESLYQFVELAIYYHGGIKKTLGTLGSGQEYDLTDTLKVFIVEASGDRLMIRYNGKNKEYTFETMPLILLHQFGKLSMPADTPTTRAAKYAFQAIAPTTTPPYRAEAIAELGKIDGEIEGAQADKVIAAIRDVFPQ